MYYYWHTKPTEEETCFHCSSTRHDQPPELVLIILYGFTRLAVWIGLSAVCGSSDVVDDSCVYVGWVRSMCGGGVVGVYGAGGQEGCFLLW